MRTRILALLLAATAAGVSAGTVEVALVNPTEYSDAGNSSFDEQRNAEELARHLQQLGQRLLPANHALRVEVLDIDLAGEQRRHGAVPGEPRVLRRMSDHARILVRYTLTVPGQAPRTGEEWISDLGYPRGTTSARASEQLHHEKRMLERWLRERFAQG